MIACQNPQKKKEIRFTLIETTDVHGSFFPYDLVNKEFAEGSLAQIYAYVSQIRKADTSEVILLDNGDILQGTPVVYYANFIDTLGKHPLCKMMNFMGYSAATVGNHDIEAGHKVYDLYRSGLHFPLMAANAIDSTTNKPYFKPYTIIKKEGVKIAVLGLITPSIPNWLPEKLWSGMYFDDMVVSARKWVKIIQEKEHPDILIGLFHSGLNASYEGADPDAKYNENASLLVAKEVPGFDAVFCGHDHKKKVFSILNNDSLPVLILNAGAHARNIAIANIDVKWNSAEKKYDKHINGELVPMRNVRPDSTFMKKFSPWFNAAKTYTQKEITTLGDSIIAKNALFGPSKFVDMIHQVQLETSGADISFAAPFSINAVIKAGPLTRADLFNLYRYENYLCTLSLKGDEIKNYLEFSTNLWFDTCLNSDGNYLLLSPEKNSYSGIDLKNAYYNFDSGAGIKYEINPKGRKGHRVHIISMADGSKFDPNKIYTVVMNSYRANGGGNHLTKGVGLSKKELRKRLIHCTNTSFRDILGKWLQKQNKPFIAKKLNLWKIN